MEQLVHKQAYLSCAIVDLIFGWSTILLRDERVVDVMFFGKFFWADVGDVSMVYFISLGWVYKGGPAVFGFRRI